MHTDELASCLGYLEYSGPLAEAGVMDASELGSALISFRSTIVALLASDAAAADLSDLSLPVRVQKGSVTIVIPQDVAGWILAAAGSAATAYVVAAAKKMAQKDFEGVGLGDLLQGALRRLANIVRVALHVGSADQKQFKSTKWRRANQEVGIPDAGGRYAYFPAEAIEQYVAFDTRLLAGLVRPVQPQRQLSIAVVENGVADEVRITVETKHSLLPSDERADDVVLPELEHGSEVTLAGMVTRGNASTNSIGMLYKGHILDCHPQEGSITRFKDCLFRECVAVVVVDRLDQSGLPSARKPKLMLRAITPVAPGPEGQTLF